MIIKNATAIVFSTMIGSGVFSCRHMLSHTVIPKLVLKHPNSKTLQIWNTWRSGSRGKTGRVKQTYDLTLYKYNSSAIGRSRTKFSVMAITLLALFAIGTTPESYAANSNTSWLQDEIIRGMEDNIKEDTLKHATERTSESVTTKICIESSQAWCAIAKNNTVIFTKSIALFGILGIVMAGFPVIRIFYD